MSATTTANRQPAYIVPVSVGTVNGGLIGGRIRPFSPNLPNLILQEGDALRKPGEEAKRIHIAAERIAYVAFHRPDGAKRPEITFKDPEELRVHVGGGQVFDVIASAQRVDHLLGFFAFPTDENSPYESFYFYASGINAKENSTALGELLIREGALAPDAVEVGLAHQDADRKIPIGEILIQQKKVSLDQIEEAAAIQTTRKRLRIGEVLVEQGLATEGDIQAALDAQRTRRGKRIGEVLVELGVVSEVALFRVLARKFHMPFIDLDEVDINPDAAHAVTPDTIRKFRVLPLDVTATTMTVAIKDPLNTEVHDVLRFQFKGRIQEVLAAPSQLERFVEAYFSALEDEADEEDLEDSEEIRAILAMLEAESDDYSDDDEDPLVDLEESDSAIVRLVNKIIRDAYRRGVSDIHIEPNGPKDPVTVRFRIDGECSMYQKFPPQFRHAISARVKIMSELDISERRKPQDGKIKFRMREREIELRVATIPTSGVGNEDVVMRILASSEPLPLDAMGFSERNMRELKRVIERPYGLILVVGPTGSGKTTTLHSCLGYINRVDRKIWTAEDPVEITQAGLRQVQVKKDIGFTFAAAMRAFLRADPDVIMIGEMRDHETAHTGIEASLTGHLVLSTLHTNSAPETITRLLDMNLDPFSFGDALLGVMAQRLGRRLCTKCRVQYVAEPAEWNMVVEAYGGAELVAKKLGITDPDQLVLWRGEGCGRCGGTGYKGRIAIHEFLVSNDEIKDAVQGKATAERIKQLSLEGGMTTLMMDGIEKAIAGKTTLEKVLAVCNA